MDSPWLPPHSFPPGVEFPNCCNAITHIPRRIQNAWPWTTGLVSWILARHIADPGHLRWVSWCLTSCSPPFPQPSRESRTLSHYTLPTLSYSSILSLRIRGCLYRSRHTPSRSDAVEWCGRLQADFHQICTSLVEWLFYCNLSWLTIILAHSPS